MAERTDAYRIAASMPLALVEPVKLAPRGLKRSNGACCTCTAPGRIWRWWNDVQYEDEWYCRHGFGWIWKQRTSPGGGYDWSRWELLHKGDPK